ncbi:MAG: RNA polymerase sigma factor [Planctomycetes bacterium]|nr:RNA polymerase sigma factor [Planctomycetota bacterium]
MTTSDELLLHASFVQALARRLLIDEHDADDIAQSAWVVALERAPASAVPVRPWLARVVQNLARRFRRSEARRDAHECASRVREPEDPPETRVALEETMKAMTDAVIDLTEPYRSAILLRFYEGLSIEQIAARQRAPAGTVKTHLRRGLELLRRRLDAAHEGSRSRWLSALAPLAGLPGIRAAGMAAGATAGAAMATAARLKAAVVCATLLAVGAAVLATVEVWPFGPATPPPPNPVVAPPPVAQSDEPPASAPPPVAPAAAASSPGALPAASPASAEEPAPLVPRKAAALEEEVPPGTAVLRFAIAAEPAVTTVRLRLYSLADPRAEWHDTPVAMSFQGLRARCEAPEPSVDRVVPGRVGPAAPVAFEVTGVSAGPTLVWIEAGERGGHVRHLRLDSGERRDLGPVSLTDRNLRVTVVDRETRQPIPGAAVQCVHEVFAIGSSRQTDSHGSLAWPHFVGTAVRITKTGYTPAFEALAKEKDAVEVALAAAAEFPVSASPGTWVFVDTRRVLVFATADASGVAHLPLAQGDQPDLAIFYEPAAGRWFAGPLRDGKLPSGPASLKVEVTAGGKPLAAGSLTLQFRDAGKPLLRIAGIINGIAEFPDLPLATCAPLLRCGPLFHDNDHEYHFPPLEVQGANTAVRLDVPGAELNVQIVDGSAAPRRFQTVFFSVRGEDPTRGLRFKILSKGRTNAEGKIVFRWLPPVEGLLRLESKNTGIPITPAPRLQIVHF